MCELCTFPKSGHIYIHIKFWADIHRLVLASYTGCGSQLYWHISPYIPSTQFGFIKGTGAQDCGVALAFTAL